MSSSFENDFNDDIDLDIENRKKRQKISQKKKTNLNINSPKHIEYSDTNDIKIEPNEDIFNNNKSESFYFTGELVDKFDLIDWSQIKRRCITELSDFLVKKNF
jgi:hypothetical protein